MREIERRKSRRREELERKRIRERRAKEKAKEKDSRERDRWERERVKGERKSTRGERDERKREDRRAAAPSLLSWSWPGTPWPHSQGRQGAASRSCTNCWRLAQAGDAVDHPKEEEKKRYLGY